MLYNWKTAELKDWLIHEWLYCTRSTILLELAHFFICFAYFVVALDARPNPYEIVFSEEGLPSMTWRYPEPRALSAIHIIPIPFTTFTSYPSPVMEEDRLVSCLSMTVISQESSTAGEYLYGQIKFPL